MWSRQPRASAARRRAVLTSFGRGCREGQSVAEDRLCSPGMIRYAGRLGRARAALAPVIEAAADRIEAERRIVPDVVAALHDAGLFRMLLPVSLGGGGADIVAFNQVIETIAAADASTAWCLAQQVASTQAAASSIPKIAREIFASPTAPSPGARRQAPRRSSPTAATSSTAAGALPAAASIARGSAAIAR